MLVSISASAMIGASSSAFDDSGPSCLFEPSCAASFPFVDEPEASGTKARLCAVRCRAPLPSQYLLAKEGRYVLRDLCASRS